MIATLLTTLLWLAACGGGGAAPVVLAAPPPPAPPAAPPAPTPTPDPDPTQTPPAGPFVAIVGGVTVIGGSGGQAPHAVHVQANVDADGATWTDSVSYAVGARVESADGSTVYVCTSAHVASQLTEPGIGPEWSGMWAVYSTTGSGFWPEGRWQYQFQRADGSPLDAADRDWMRVVDPISGELVYTDDRFSAGPTAAFVFRSAGSYRVRVRYQNRDKDWSDWVVSTPIPVAVSTRTKLYVNGATGNDANDGLAAVATAGQGPKATLNGALAALNADNLEIEIADDTTCYCNSVVNTSSRSGLWIHRSGGGTAKPKVILAAEGFAITLGNNSMVEGLEFEYDGSNTTNSVTWGVSKSNVAVVDCDYNECASVIESGSDRRPSGVLLLRLRTKEKVDRYGVYIDNATSVSLLGCRLDRGSEREHMVRVATGSMYIAIEYCSLDYASDDTSKSCFRCYARHVGVYRSVLARGTVSLGNIDIDDRNYRDYCIDGCVILFDGSSLAAIFIWENVGRVVIRTSFIKKSMTLQVSVISIEDNAGGGDTSFSGLRLYNVTVQNTGTGNNSSILRHGALTQSASDIVVRGMLMSHSSSDAWTWGVRFSMTSSINPSNTPTSLLASRCVFEDNVHSLAVANEFATAGATYALQEANEQPWASGLIVEEHALDGLGQPLGQGEAWKTAVRSSVGVFRSLNGIDWEATGPAGAWYPPAE
jgi:hypothetical protein